MTTPDAPILSENQREVLQRWVLDWAARPPNLQLIIIATLAEIDRLKTQVDALATELAHVAHDRMEDGDRSLIDRWIEQAVSEERQRNIDLLVENANFYGNDSRNGRILHRLAKDIAARGKPLAPIPPTLLQAENERLQIENDALRKRLMEG